jgi:hypothetical protein
VAERVLQPPPRSPGVLRSLRPGPALVLPRRAQRGEVAQGSRGPQRRSVVRGCLCGERARRVCEDLGNLGSRLRVGKGAVSPGGAFPSRNVRIAVPVVREGRRHLGTQACVWVSTPSRMSEHVLCEAWEPVARTSLLV